MSVLIQFQTPDGTGRPVFIDPDQVALVIQERTSTSESPAVAVAVNAIKVLVLGYAEDIASVIAYGRGHPELLGIWPVEELRVRVKKALEEGRGFAG